jgi:hypothetical protein
MTSPEYETWIAEHQSEPVDVVFGGVYSIKSYYMENDNPRQMRGASQWLVDLFNDRPEPPPVIFGITIDSTVGELLKKHGGALCISAGATFLGVVPKGCGAEIAQECERLVLNYTVTAQVAVIFREIENCSDLLNEERFPHLRELLYIDFERRRFLKFPPVKPLWDDTGNLDPLLKHRPKLGDSYIELYKRKNGQALCDRCRLREVEFMAHLKNEGDFFLCPSCAHKEFRGAFIQRNRFRDDCAEYVNEKNIIGDGRLVTASMLFENTSENATKPAEDNPLWFGTTNDYADKNGDIALLYADINNLGDALRALRKYNIDTQKTVANAVADTLENALETTAENLSYSIGEYINLHNAVTDTVQKSLYYSLAVSVEKLYDSQDILFPRNWETDYGQLPKSYPTRFEIVAAGGDDICVILPGSVALKAGTLLMEKFEEHWKAQKEQLGIDLDLTLSVGLAVGQAQTPINFMHNVAEQLLKIAKQKAHELQTAYEARKKGGEKATPPQSVLDIQVLNSEAQWATSIKDKLREQLKKTEEPGKTKGKYTANLTGRPFSKSESQRLLDLIATAESNIPLSTLHTIAAALKQCGIAEGNLWFDYLVSKQSDKDAENGKDKYDRTKLGRLAREISPDCKMYYTVSSGALENASEESSLGKTLVSPWYDLVELRGQIGGESLWPENR